MAECRSPKPTPLLGAGNQVRLHVDGEVAQKNMGYWWMALSLGTLIGGLCNYFYFDGVTEISANNRVMVYAISVSYTHLRAHET